MSNRRDFIKNTMMAGIGSTVLPNHLPLDKNDQEVNINLEKNKIEKPRATKKSLLAELELQDFVALTNL
jgi:hypothetical protein